MIEDRGVPFDPQQVGDVSPEAALTYIHSAQRMLTWDRKRGMAALHALFRSGFLPEPAPNGAYIGRLLALDIAPGFTWLAAGVARRYMPWQGKTFDAAGNAGDNIFANSSRPLARLMWPSYRDYVRDTESTYRAFPFRTAVGFGLQEQDCTVLKIDYNSPVNPRLSVRRVLDEIVELTPGIYLGQAHLRWWSGRWQLVAYFLLLAPSLAAEWRTHPGQ